ncbi:hypothetical protein CONPUDRAFT_80306 [Coniophora puteana RWD-64-598 SS2]|uniref:Uncharacterized protein n=1 Tax=Coniophora puteana (strain RWD-64-598) TaxID=741705 RepID=A0A5M3MWZ3_CONPW|nr:uncharacterized protein CONPUDRAFT_80306 [Coniophora puteana RWD-64-598 SS2]EIW83663.1 hypothetical protein CONPUDRAFT_80306 [Coniophora puteana RWD-64-598 SS2]
MQCSDIDETVKQHAAPYRSYITENDISHIHLGRICCSGCLRIIASSTRCSSSFCAVDGRLIRGGYPADDCTDCLPAPAACRCPSPC